MARVVIDPIPPKGKDWSISVQGTALVLSGIPATSLYIDLADD